MLCDYRPSTGLYRQGEECVWSIFDEVKMWITVIVEQQSPANHCVMFMVEQKHFTRLERVWFAFFAPSSINSLVTSLALRFLLLLIIQILHNTKSHVTFLARV